MPARYKLDKKKDNINVPEDYGAHFIGVPLENVFRVEEFYVIATNHHNNYVNI